MIEVDDLVDDVTGMLDDLLDDLLVVEELDVDALLVELDLVETVLVDAATQYASPKSRFEQSEARSGFHSIRLAILTPRVCCSKEHVSPETTTCH